MFRMAHRAFALRRRGADTAELHALDALTDQADPAEAARIVAEASAANLPEGNKTAARYLADPVRSFAVTEARTGVLHDVQATFVRIGRTSASNGASARDTTFAFAALPERVAWSEVWPRPHWVPISPDLAIGHEEFDARYMVAGEDPERTLAPPVIECFLAAPEEAFSWVSIWGDHVCAHGVHGPAGHADDDRLVEFVVAVTRAMRHAR
jgi:hypothetical protein